MTARNRQRTALDAERAREELARLATEAQWWGGVEQELGDGVLTLLDHITRLEAQSAIRGRAVVMYRERARRAEAERDAQTAQCHYWKRAHENSEARIGAVRDVLDLYAPEADISTPVPATPLRHALRSDRPERR